MAETPKDKDAPVTPRPADDSLSAGTRDGTPILEGAAAAADDALAADPEIGDARDSQSGPDAHDHIEGAGGEEKPDTDPLPPTPASPWSDRTDAPISTKTPPAPKTKEKPAAAKSGAKSASASASASAAPSSAKAAAKPSGGAGRVLVPLIVAVLVVGGGYATYPLWRDRIEPYAEMLGLPLPAAPEATETAGVAAAETPPATPVATPAATPEQTPDKTPAEPAAAVEEKSAPAGVAEPASASASATEVVQGPAVSPAEIAELATRLSAVEQTVARLSAAQQSATQPSDAAPMSPVDADSAAAGDTAAFGERIDDLETRLLALSDEMAIVRQGLGQADETDGVGALAARLSERLGDLDRRLADLNQGLAGLDQRLAGLEQAPKTPSISPEQLAVLAQRVDELTTRMNGDTSTLGQRITDLATAQEHLSQRQAQGRDARERAGVFLFATNLLAATSAGSGGFVPELDAVRTAAPDTPAAADALAVLSAHADGAASKADLRSAFPAVAAAVIDASIVGADDGVVGTVMTRIASLVTLRRTETAEGNAIDGAVNRAEAAVNAGDLDAALSALSALDGDPAKVAAPWVEKAKARAAVDGAVRALQALALAAASES